MASFEKKGEEDLKFGKEIMNRNVRRTDKKMMTIMMRTPKIKSGREMKKEYKRKTGNREKLSKTV